jgi:hypothetical protein
MKKIFLTLAICFSTLLASSQIQVVSTIEKPEDGEKWAVSNFTNNIGVGYEVSDKILLGVIKNAEDYDLYGRYTMGKTYIAGQMTTDSTSDLTISIGYSIKIVDGLYLEPNYSTGLDENDEGKFRFGVAYRF